MNGTSPNKEAELISCFYGNDVVKLSRLAVASRLRPFNIPKQFKLERGTR